MFHDNDAGFRGTLITIQYYAFTTAVFLLAADRKLLWLSVWPLFCVAAAISGYFVTNYGIEINSNAITIFFQATPRETESFVNAELFVDMTPALLLLIAGLFLPISKGELSRKQSALIFVTLIAAYYLISTQQIIQKLAPYNSFHAAVGYIKNLYEIEKKLSRRVDISELYSIIPNARPPQIIVVIIGESARSDHFSLNGYKRNTNPLLKNTDNIISFYQAYSCATSTRLSVPCLMTRATQSDHEAMYTETSFIRLFQDAGYYTVWLGNQGTFSKNDISSMISQEAQERIFFAPTANSKRYYDGHLLKYIEGYVNQHKKLLLIIHTNGSHFQYQYRYPRAFAEFKPDCYEEKKPASGNTTKFSINDYIAAMNMTHFELVKKFLSDGEVKKKMIKCLRKGNLINAYDNSIRYTDWFLHEVFRQLKNRNALAVYVSDHGQSLGERGLYMHGHEKELSNWHVPMIWWASDAYINYNSVLWSQLHSKKSENVSHDNIFHSIIGCSGFESDVIDTDLNLCSHY